VHFYGGATLDWNEVEFELSDLAERYIRSEYATRPDLTFEESVRHFLAYGMDLSWDSEDDLAAVIVAIRMR
jgi:hypothetical protein